MDGHEVPFLSAAPERPVTRAGRFVRDALRSDDWSTSLRKLPRQCWPIVDQIAVIALRRRFARDARLEELSEFVTATLGAERDAADAITFVRKVLGRQDGHAGMDARRLGDLLVALLPLLRIDGSLPDGDVDRLTVTAEARAVRVLSKTHGVRSARSRLSLMRRRPALVREYEGQDLPADARPVPASIIGQKLKAIARFDFERRDRLPAGADDAGIIAVVDEMFSLVLHDRFASGYEEKEIADLARRVRSTSAAPLDLSAIEELVRRELRPTGGIELIDASQYLTIKIMTMAQLVEDLGLYDAELDALLVRAEEAAASQGVRPVSVRP